MGAACGEMNTVYSGYCIVNVRFWFISRGFKSRERLILHHSGMKLRHDLLRCPLKQFTYHGGEWIMHFTSSYSSSCCNAIEVGQVAGSRASFGVIHRLIYRNDSTLSPAQRDLNTECRF